jgi:hypothetical protein
LFHTIDTYNGSVGFAGRAVVDTAVDVVPGTVVATAVEVDATTEVVGSVEVGAVDFVLVHPPATAANVTNTTRRVKADFTAPEHKPTGAICHAARWAMLTVTLAIWPQRVDVIVVACGTRWMARCETCTTATAVDADG